MALAELYHGEVQNNSALRRTFLRRWEGLSSDLSYGSNGWTGTGLPLIGDAYPYGTWTSKVTPTCTSVHIDPRAMPAVSIVTAYYSCPRVSGD